MRKMWVSLLSEKENNANLPLAGTSIDTASSRDYEIGSQQAVVDSPQFRNRVFIGVGTNLGNKEQNLNRAMEEIRKIAKVLVCSPVYETEPIGLADQPLFYNQVIEIRTALTPEKLLVALKTIERKMGRVPTIRNGPRIIDCDILYYKDIIVETETLVIPHPRAAERAFVLVPLANIAPEFLDPIQKKSIQQLVKELPEEDKRKVKQIVPTLQYS